MLNSIKALKKYFYKSRLKLSIDLSQNLKIQLIFQVFASSLVHLLINLQDFKFFHLNSIIFRLFQITLRSKSPFFD
jgi:hypothetical protein